MEPSQTIGQRIKQVRGELSQKAFGARIGLSQTAVTALENDQSEPRLGTFNSIVDAFNVNPEWLRTGQGSPVRSLGTLLVDSLRPLVPSSQLPPAIPSRFEEAEPGKGTMRILGESDELRQVKSERDFLRDQNKMLLEILKSNSYNYADDAPLKKAVGSEYAAAPEMSMPRRAIGFGAVVTDSMVPMRVSARNGEDVLITIELPLTFQERMPLKKMA
jgi:transcriptional regulator with XRE-family HTH domain